MKLNKYIYAWLSGSAVLFATACADKDMAAPETDNTLPGELREVTFNVIPQKQTTGTRDEEIKDPDMSFHISDGSHIDDLIFAVYEKVESEDKVPAGAKSITYTYVKDGQTVKETYFLNMDFVNEDMAVKVNGVKNGQNHLEVDGVFPEGFATIKVQTEADKEYLIAFWAQNIKCTAYDTSDLSKVEVNYEGALNNEELRDAFCGMVTFSGKAQTQTVILKRPFAQVNVGTVGWDYEGEAALKPSPVSYQISKIEFKGVAKYYDVINGKTLSSDDFKEIDDLKDKSATTDVTFSWNRLPAFIHWDVDKNKVGPEFALISYTSFEKDEFLRVERDRTSYKDEKAFYSDSELKLEKEAEEKGETYIKNPYEPKLDADGYAVYVPYKEYLDFQSDYWTAFNDQDDPKRPFTESYKYLSMSYILVPEASDIQNIEGVTTGSVLSEVTFTAKGGEVDNEGKVQKPDINKNDNTISYTLHNVPVQKNWRTNILGDSFFITNVKGLIYLVPDYCGEHDKDSHIDDDKWLWDEKFGNTQDGSLQWTSNGGGYRNPEFDNLYGNKDNKGENDDYYQNHKNSNE
ncbi:MAG: hypothetical protein J1F12_00970 [Muribaculaceae bacterium]|nr:hypothetical protein [Muribaculaceae bacterium]